jgi:hypothetical protein
MGSEEEKEKISIDEYNKINCGGMLLRGLSEVVVIEYIKARFITRALNVVKNTIFKAYQIPLKELPKELSGLPAGMFKKQETKVLSEAIASREGWISRVGWKSQRALKQEMGSIIDNSGISKKILKEAGGEYITREEGGLLVKTSIKDALSSELAEKIAQLEAQSEVLGSLGAPGWIIGAVLDAITIFSIIMTVDFGIADAPFEEMLKGGYCTFIEGANISKMSGECSNGKLKDKQCESCRQIVNMKDYEKNYDEKYDFLKKESQKEVYISSNSRDKYNNVFGSYSPSVTNKLTSLVCKNGKDDVTFAKRPFPIGGCVYWDYDGSQHWTLKGQKWNDNDRYGIAGFGKNLTSSDEDYLLNNFTFLTTDQNNCLVEWDTVNEVPKAWDMDGDRIDKAKSDDANSGIRMDFKQMEYIVGSPIQEIGECTKKGIGIDNYFENFKCMWAYHNPVRRAMTTIGDLFILGLTGKSEYKEKMPQMKDNNRVSKYDGPNVCTNDLELSGSIIKDLDYREDPANRILNKNPKDKVDVSNHCCPPVIGAAKCPHYHGPENVRINTPASAFNPKDDAYDDDIYNCYVLGPGMNIGTISHPELVPYNMILPLKENSVADFLTVDGNTNKSISRFKRGGIQCGPKQKNIASPWQRYPGGEFTPDGSTYYYNKDGDDVLDVIRTTTNKKATDNLSNYYGTRFKLNNDYNFYYDEDSGATGYENYLDPGNHIHLPCHESGNCDGSTKFQSYDWKENYKKKNRDDITKSIYDIDEYTTINDVIARENGHPDRMKPLCDNVICNDLEKTKYMQTVYDTMCTNYDSSNKLRNKYKKFYRPAGIKNYDKNVVDNNNIHSYSDICCSPIPFSNKWAFVGCDAKGQNSYFIDNIISEYNIGNNPSPTLPKELYIPSSTKPNEGIIRERIRINPQRKEKQNLNQCIPSEKNKCATSGDYLALISNSKLTEDQRKVEFSNISNKCKQKEDEYLLLGMTDYDNDNYMNNNAVSKDKLCNDGFGGEIKCSYNSGFIRSDYDYYKFKTSLASPSPGEPRPSPKPPSEFEPEGPGDARKEEYWRYGRAPEGYVPYKGQIYNKWSGWSSVPDSHSKFTLSSPDNDRYTECVPIPWKINVSDIEIYDKSIDWDKEKQKLRYIGTSPPPSTAPEAENYFKIKCKYYDGHLNRENLNTTIDSNSYKPVEYPDSGPNEYHYDIRCIQDPSTLLDYVDCSPSPGDMYYESQYKLALLKLGDSSEKDKNNYLKNNCTNFKNIDII